MLDAAFLLGSEGSTSREDDIVFEPNAGR